MKNIDIHRSEANGIYYARYRTKINDPVQGEITIQRNISTGLTNRLLAQRWANNKQQEDLREFLRGTKVKVKTHGNVTCGQVIDRFLKHSQLTSKKEIVKDFCILVAEGLGQFNLDRSQREEFVYPTSLATLSPEQLIAFRDQKEQLRGANNIHAIMRSGKSLFSRRAMDYYRDLNIPANVRAWMEVSKPERARGEDETFQPIDETILAKMDSAARKDSPADSMMLQHSREEVELGHDAEAIRWHNAYAAYWLMRRCGLRNSEVENLRWEWFEVSDSKIELVLIKRPYWTPKYSGGRVPVAPDLYVTLFEVYGPKQEGENGFVLRGEARDRYEGVNEFVNKFVRQYLPDRAKGAYELRKQFGSETAADYDIATAARLLRHKGLETAYKHYYTPLKNVVPR